MNSKTLRTAILLLLLLAATSQTRAQTPQYAFTYGTGGNAIPLGTGTSWDNYRSQWLYLPGYFTPTPPGSGLLTKIYFRCSGTASATTWNNFKVSVGNTTLTSLTTTYITTGMTQVVNASTYSWPAAVANQWMEIELTTPVAVDLSMPLVIDISQTGKVGGVGGYALLAGTPPHTGNTQTYSSGATSTTGSARNYSYQFGFDIITCSTAITKNPVPAITICENGTVGFSAAAIDVDDYQWQVDEGSGFFDIINNTNYSGATSDSLTVSNIPAGFDGNKYRCLAMKSSCIDTTTEASLNVNALVRVDPLADRDTTCIGSTKELEVKSTGAITGYRWQIYIDGMGYVDVPHTPPYVHSGPTLRIEGVPDTLDGAIFRCLINGVCNAAASNNTNLKVNIVPVVAVPPQDVLAETGQTVSFKVQASGAGATYQWQVSATDPDTFVNVNNNGIYEGVKTNRLVVKAVSRVQDNFKFRCIVGTSSGCIVPGDTSAFALLNVNPATSVSTVAGEGEMQLYPNPARSAELFIRMTGVQDKSDLKYILIDKTGRVVTAGNINSRNDITTVNVEHLPADMYLVKIIEAGGKAVAQQRFTKL